MKRVNKSFDGTLVFFLMFAALFLPGFGNFAAEVSATDCPADITLKVTQGSPDVVSVGIGTPLKF